MTQAALKQLSSGARAAVRSPAVLLMIGMGAPLAVGARYGPDVARWCAVGLVGTAAYLWGTWLGIRLAGRSAASTGGGLVLALVFLLKVPPVVLLAFAVRGARAETRDGLLYGASVVYSWLVAWGLLPSEPASKPPSSPSL